MQLGDPEPRPVVDVKRLNLPMRPHLDLSRVVSKITNPGPAAMDLSVDHIASVLRQIFDIRTVIRLSQPEKIKAYRMLSNALALETRAAAQPCTEACAIALDNLLASAGGSRNEFELLLAAIERQPAFSCGLLRLLTSAVSSANGTSRLLPIVSKICHKIAPVDPDGHSSLKSIALQFVKSHGVVRSESSPADLSTLDLSSKRLERHLQQLAAHALETNDTRSLVSSIVSSLSQSGFKKSFVGLLIDWMELLDPEMITAQPDVEVSVTILLRVH